MSESLHVRLTVEIGDDTLDLLERALHRLRPLPRPHTTLRLGATRPMEVPMVTVPLKTGFEQDVVATFRNDAGTPTPVDVTQVPITATSSDEAIVTVANVTPAADNTAVQFTVQKRAAGAASVDVHADSDRSPSGQRDLMTSLAVIDAPDEATSVSVDLVGEARPIPA